MLNLYFVNKTLVHWWFFCVSTCTLYNNLLDSLYRSTQNIHVVVEIQHFWFWNLKSCACVSYRIRIVSAAGRIVPNLIDSVFYCKCLHSLKFRDVFMLKNMNSLRNSYFKSSINNWWSFVQPLLAQISIQSRYWLYNLNFKINNLINGNWVI